MKTIKVIIITCMIQYGSADAQEIIASGGGFFSNSSGSVCFTVGEPVIETFSSNGLVLTQGFQQPKIIATGLPEVSSSKYQISVFPNPASEFLKIRLSSAGNYDVRYELFSIDGRELMNGRIHDTETEVSFLGFSPSIYFLKILFESGEIRTFKIVK